MIKSHYKISYILTTYNKLPYLQQVLSRLVAARLEDEEIIVCDGGSKDGTPKYLQKLFEADKIQQFVSERDKGEAHGFNKGMLMARGEIIKIITDDDAFSYPSIREAAEFMLSHPDIDVMSGNSWNISLEDLTHFSFVQYSYDNYLRWLKHRQSVNLIGLPLLIRRSSLAITGLFYTGMVQVDGEFTYRITSLNVNIAWSSAILSIRIDNPQSNFRNMNRKDGEAEVEKMQFLYQGVEHDLYYWIRYKSKLFKAIKMPFRPIKKMLIHLKGSNKPKETLTKPSNYKPEAGNDLIATAFQLCDQFIEDYNSHYPAEYLYRQQEEPIKKIMKPQLAESAK